ncbi:MAG: hypothetical protein ABI467_31435 [Kofleriaceae bacterium]
MQRSAGLPVLIAVVLASAGARAGDADEAKALFERGRGLVKAGDSAGACPLFEHSLALAPALGTKLNLAICWAAIGRLVDAEQLFQQLIKETADAHQPERAQLAKDGLDQLDTRMPHVKIDASNLPVATSIEVDGKLVDAGAPVALDPGHHTIHATHARPVELSVEEGELAEVKLDALTLVPRPRQVWIAGAVAGGALVASAAAGLAVLGERGSARHHCATVADGALVCDQRGLDLLDRAHAMAHVSTGFLVVGVGAAALTAVLELAWRRANQETTLRVVQAPNAIGVGWAGSW